MKCQVKGWEIETKPRGLEVTKTLADGTPVKCYPQVRRPRWYLAIPLMLLWSKKAFQRYEERRQSGILESH